MRMPVAEIASSFIGVVHAPDTNEEPSGKLVLGIHVHDRVEPPRRLRSIRNESNGGIGSHASIQLSVQSLLLAARDGDIVGLLGNRVDCVCGRYPRVWACDI